MPVNNIIQACWIVSDLQEAMPRFQRTMGCGPFFFIENSTVDNAVYLGNPTKQVSDIGLAQAGDMQIELIQPKTPCPSVYLDVIPPGTEGFHHLCYFTEDYDGERARYEAMGAPAAFEGIFGDMRVAYYDTRKLTGFMTEVLEDNAGVKDLFAMIRHAAEGWDGRDPIRPISV